MKNVIKDIIAGNNIPNIMTNVISNLYRLGPISVTDLEILSYLAYYRPEEFNKRLNEILNFMGVFYKELDRFTLKEVIFSQYKKYIKETYHNYYTPVQANIVRGTNDNLCFSFSAPTSTGKSFVIINKIKECKGDVVVVVPSRALINEYFLKLNEQITDKSINILTFIDKINTKHVSKNIFIVTPERCRELFKQKEQFNIVLFLFDEAQLSNEDSIRGLYFDSIVRRSQKAFPAATFVFAHPFVKNPEAQIEKNHFDGQTSASARFTQKNVGQMFLCTDNKWNFYHFGIDKQIMGSVKQKCLIDPIAATIEKGGSVLFYVSKSKIYSKNFVQDFGRYINMCPEINSSDVDFYIEQLKSYTGGDIKLNQTHYSKLISFLKRGIVIHHGSMPLQTRLVMEQFTKNGLCRICFATSTLEQGINMPFDLVYLDRFEKSKPLSIKNLIGRAGRSTQDLKFDFGYVVLGSTGNMANFRSIMVTDEVLDTVSAIEKDDEHDDDYNDFKEAILNDTFSDEFNLTEKEIQKLTSEGIDSIISEILNSTFIGSELIPLITISNDETNRHELYYNFRRLYAAYLGRRLENGEANVLDTAIKIILWRVHGRTFKNICWYRYSYVTQSRELNNNRKLGKSVDTIAARFFTGYNDIPDKKLKVFSLFPEGTKAIDVDYDIIMYDTYDFIDKLIGFKLSDIFYAAFMKYHEKYRDVRAFKLSNYIKYGTDNARYIWMLRYGMSFEDIEVLDIHIDTINESEIVFKESINNISHDLKRSIQRFLF